MLVPGLFALTLKLFSKPLSKEWYWFENVPLVTRVLKTCVHASIILKKSKNILFKIYAVCLALTGWPFYGEPYCFNIGFILFVITIVSTHLNCPAAIHWIFMRENESLPLKLVKFRRNKKKVWFFSQSSNLLLLQRAVILDIFYDQAGASPGSCNSGSGLKQLFSDEMQILVQGKSDTKQNFATVCARTQNYEYTFKIVPKKMPKYVKVFWNMKITHTYLWFDKRT